MRRRQKEPFDFRDGKVLVSLPEEIRSVLTLASGIVLELVAPGSDELFPSETAPPVPEDPAIARLFPPAYDDGEAAAEFRRLTDGELRAGKLGDATRLRDSVEAIELEPDLAEAWLRSMNDARLILGSRLGIETDQDSERLWEEIEDRDEFTAALIETMHNLGILQELLIAALD